MSEFDVNMLVFEAKLEGTKEQYQSLDEAIRIKSKYEPVVMHDAQLYKWRQTIDTDEALGWIVGDFTALKRFYEDVVDQQEAVLVVTN
ncbi:MAG: DUF1877 family protein [Trichormus sp.]